MDPELDRPKTEKDGGSEVGAYVEKPNVTNLTKKNRSIVEIHVITIAVENTKRKSDSLSKTGRIPIQGSWTASTSKDETSSCVAHT
jgi:hypothetical protein